MDEQLKKRLIGGAVLVALVVIFLPMLLEDDLPSQSGLSSSPVPPRTLDQQDFQKRAVPLPGEPGGGGMALRPIEPVIPPPPVFEPPQQPATVEIGAEEKAVPARPAKPSAPATAVKPAPKAPPPAPNADGDGWVVQVASMSNKAGADSLSSKLRAAKFPAFVESAQVGGKTWYRVRLGPERDRKRIDGILAKLKASPVSAGLNPAVVSNK